MSWKARLRALERRLDAMACPECKDYPTRIVGVDPDSGSQWYADPMPNEHGCPACGRQPTVITIASPEPVDLAKL